MRERVDRVWVSSAFLRDGYVAGGMPPGIVDVVPNGVDLERFRPSPPTPARKIGEPAACTFLFVGGTIWRKGIDVLLAAWARAFGPDDDVRLVVKDFGVASSYKGQTSGEDVRALAARDDVAPVTYLTEDLPAAELPALYRAADVVVLPYRAEGFCLPALEAMACGVPVAPPGEREALAPLALAALEASGRPADALPDVLLDDPPAVRLDGLVARCDAVLLDAAAHPAARAGGSGFSDSAHELLTRRALRTLAADPPVAIRGVGPGEGERSDRGGTAGAP